MTTRASWTTAILFTALASSCASHTTSPTLDAAPPSQTQVSSDADVRVVPSAPTTSPVTSEADQLDECGHDWSAAVDPLFLALGADAVATTMSVARGCRSTSWIGDTAISVLVEPVGANVIDDVAGARQNSTALMGFVELDFVATDDRVASSLLHPETGRLVENRWVRLDATSAMRVEVTIDADGRSRRDLVLNPITALEVDAANYLRVEESARHATADPLSPNADIAAVSQALDVVLGKVSDTLVLGSLATDRGADAIAFEYAFPENFVALANARRPDDCSVDAATAHCDIAVGQESYRFAFTRVDSRWLLDDFAVTAQQPPSTPNED